ncbi:MAG: proprotein convertase P-domain-containing protein [Phycisphaerales bacterium]
MRHGTFRIALAAWAGLCACAAAGWAQPVNDQCGSATAVAAGVPEVGTTIDATADGTSDCNPGPTADVYHRFTPMVSGVYTFTLCGAGAVGGNWDSVISLHAGCPADGTTQIACDDEGCRPAGATDFGYASSISITLPAGVEITVRVSGYDAGVPGTVYSLLVVGPAPATGACCFLGQCGVATAPACAQLGGEYRGDYTACFTPANDPVSVQGPGAPAAIPDNSPAGIGLTAQVQDELVIGDVRLELNLTHTFCGDLAVTLSHEGVTATIMRRVGGGDFGDDSNLSGVYAFTDGGAVTIWAAAVSAPGTQSVVPPGAYRAADQYANTVSLRSAFAGLPAAGAWTLTISDNGALDTGVLNGWRLVLDRSAGDPCDETTGACCFGSICRVVPPAGCVGASRRFVGVGAACNVPGNETTPCCRADFNQGGTVTVQDVFDYLEAYFTQSPSADFNGAGLSLQDLFEFLGGFFTGCG